MARRTPSSVAGPLSSSGPWAARRSRLRSRGSLRGWEVRQRRGLLGWGERPGRGPLQRSFKPRQPDSEVASDGSHVHCLSVGRWARCPVFPAGLSRGDPAPDAPLRLSPGSLAGVGGERQSQPHASECLVDHPETTALDETRACSRSPAHYRFRSGQQRAPGQAPTGPSPRTSNRRTCRDRRGRRFRDGKQQCHRRDRGSMQTGTGRCSSSGAV